MQALFHKSDFNGTYWHDRLLKEPLPSDELELIEFRSDVSSDLRNEASLFGDEFSVGVNSDFLDSWYYSDTGQDELVRVINAIWNEMTYWAEHAMPAHDARHAIYKVPSDAIEHMHAEGVLGWERVGVIGALLHDFGRWSEERIFGGPRSSSNHSRMSFVLAKEILNKFGLPLALKNHILLGVIRHTKGAVHNDPMVHKIVVAADRTQLYGPERVLRSLHHAIDKKTGDYSEFFGGIGSMTLLGQINKYLQTRILGPLFAREDHFAHMWKMIYLFCIICDPKQDLRWRQIIEDQSSLPLPLQGISYEQFVQEANEKSVSGADAKSMIEAFLSAKHVAPNLQYKVECIDKLKTVPDECLANFGAAMGFAYNELLMENKRQTLALNQIRNNYDGNDLMITTLIDLVKDIA